MIGNCVIRHRIVKEEHSSLQVTRILCRSFDRSGHSASYPWICLHQKCQNRRKNIAGKAKIDVSNDSLCHFGQNDQSEENAFFCQNKGICSKTKFIKLASFLFSSYEKSVFFGQFDGVTFKEKTKSNF